MMSLSVVVPMYSPTLWNVHDVTVSGGSCTNNMPGTEVSAPSLAHPTI